MMSNTLDFLKIESAMMVAVQSDYSFIPEHASPISSNLVNILKQRKMVAERYLNSKITDADRLILVEHFQGINKSICELLGIVT